MKFKEAEDLIQKRNKFKSEKEFIKEHENLSNDSSFSNSQSITFTNNNQQTTHQLPKPERVILFFSFK